jgi:WD40 repeat protein
LDFSEDSSKVVSGGRDSLVILWDNKGTLIRKLTYHKGKVTAVKFDPSGNLIYSGSTDKRIICYSLSEDKIIFESKVHTNDILSLDISRNGKLIASGGADGMVYIHDTGKGDVINNIDNNKIWVRSVKFNSNSTRLAIGNDNGSIQCWSIIDPLNIKLLTKTRYSRGWVTGLDFFPDNSSIVYSYENGLIGLNTNNTDYKLKLKVPLRMIEIQPGNSPFFVIAAASYGNGLMLIKGSSIDK